MIHKNQIQKIKDFSRKGNFFYFFKLRVYFLKQFQIHRKIEGKVQRGSMTPPPHMNNLPHYPHLPPSGAFVTIDEPTLHVIITESL